MMNLVLVVLALCTLQVVSVELRGAVARGLTTVGGPTWMDRSDPALLAVLDIAIAKSHPGGGVTVSVENATKQVVSGLQYVIVADVTVTATGKCTRERFDIWDHFGDVKVMMDEKMEDHCP